MFCPEDGAALEIATEGAPSDTPSSVSDTHDPLIGRVLDSRYELTKLLGIGGMGRVYLARHLFLERSVAVKILHRGRVTHRLATDRRAHDALGQIRLRRARRARD